MQNNLLRLEDMTSFQDWTCREDHFDLQEHDGTSHNLEFGIEENKPWTTVEDQDIDRIEALALELRERPLLPPCPEDASRPWPEVNSGIAFPICHCAVRDCAWVSDRPPCVHRSPDAQRRQTRHAPSDA